MFQKAISFTKNKSKLYYRLLKNYLLFRRKTASNIYNPNSPTVFFDLKDFRHERYYFPVIYSFHEQGYNIFIKNNFKFIGHSFGTGRFIYDLERVKITSGNDRVEICITDHYSSKKKKFSKNVFLNYRVRRDMQKFILPYPMHPNAYRFHYIDNLYDLRKTERNVRITFSGNVIKDAYNTPIIKARFGKLNRYEIIKTISEKISSELLIESTNVRDFSLRGSYLNGVRLCAWEWSPAYSKNLHLRIPDDKWLEFLANSDFFLCCPGIVIPQSHNAIEAMAVGTIPILEYAEYFHPNLVHEQNCIIFQSKSDLLDKIKEVLTYDSRKIENMRAAVIKYYEDFLHHDRPASIIQGLPNNYSEVYFYNEVP